VPIGNAAMDDRTFIEWDKDDSTRWHDEGRCAGAGHADLHPQMLRSDRPLITASAGTTGDIPQEEAASTTCCARPTSIGVFQVESRAQMSCCRA
jgi:error-prone DNA polymerase